MASNLPGSVRQFGVALRALLVFTVILGIVYPLVMTGVAQALFHGNANGSIIKVNGKEVASDLIGQAYTMDSGKLDSDGKAIMVADPKWFQTRPSASDYDAKASGGSNLGPNNADLLAATALRRSGRRRPVPSPARRGHGQRQRSRSEHQPGVRRSAGQSGRP
jgi:K+-transporting ATPase ATPase C chain